MLTNIQHLSFVTQGTPTTHVKFFMELCSAVDSAVLGLFTSMLWNRYMFHKGSLNINYTLKQVKKSENM